MGFATYIMCATIKDKGVSHSLPPPVETLIELKAVIISAPGPSALDIALRNVLSQLVSFCCFVVHL